MPSSVSSALVPPKIGLGRDLEQERVRGQRQQPELVLVGRIPKCCPGIGRRRVDLGVGDQRDVPGDRPDAGNAAVRIFVDEAVEQVAVVLDLAGVDRRPQFGRLALQRRGLRHHREVGRRLACLGRLLELHQPGFAGRLGDRLDGDAGRLGEFRKDVLVEGILEVAAIDADLQRLVLCAQHRRHGKQACACKPGAQHRAPGERGLSKLGHCYSPLFAVIRRSRFHAFNHRGASASMGCRAPLQHSRILRQRKAHRRRRSAPPGRRP